MFLKYLLIFSRERDNLLKEKSHQSKTMKMLENEINKCLVRKNEIETDVTCMIENFEATKHALNKRVCIVFLIIL